MTEDDKIENSIIPINSNGLVRVGNSIEITNKIIREHEERLLQLGLIVKKLREEKGLSQTELAYKIGKDQPSINRLEKGNVNPSIIYLLQICEGLEITIEELVKSL